MERFKTREFIFTPFKYHPFYNIPQYFNFFNFSPPNLLLKLQCPILVSILFFFLFSKIQKRKKKIIINKFIGQVDHQSWKVMVKGYWIELINGGKKQKKKKKTKPEVQGSQACHSFVCFCWVLFEEERGPLFTLLIAFLVGSTLLVGQNRQNRHVKYIFNALFHHPFSSSFCLHAIIPSMPFFF
jgi:hypothetical protein